MDVTGIALGRELLCTCRMTVSCRSVQIVDRFLHVEVQVTAGVKFTVFHFILAVTTLVYVCTCVHARMRPVDWSIDT